MSVNQTIPSAAFTRIDYDTVSYDYGSDYNTLTKQFVCPVDGLYKVTFQCAFLNVSAGALVLGAVIHNGIAVVRTEPGSPASGEESILQLSKNLPCVSGDTIEVHSYNNGASREIISGAYSYVDYDYMGSLV